MAFIFVILCLVWIVDGESEDIEVVDKVELDISTRESNLGGEKQDEI